MSDCRGNIIDQGGAVHPKKKQIEIFTPRGHADCQAPANLPRAISLRQSGLIELWLDRAPEYRRLPSCERKAAGKSRNKFAEAEAAIVWPDPDGAGVDRGSPDLFGTRRVDIYMLTRGSSLRRSIIEDSQ